MTTNKELVIQKIEWIVYELLHSKYSYKNGRTADHFNRIKKRLRNGQKLTKKMKENLEWIEKSVVENV